MKSCRVAIVLLGAVKPFGKVHRCDYTVFIGWYPFVSACMSDSVLSQRPRGGRTWFQGQLVHLWWHSKIGYSSFWDTILANSTHIFHFNLCNPKTFFSEGGGTTKNILPYMQMGGEHGIHILIVVVVFYSRVVSRLICHAGSPIFTSNLKSQYTVVIQRGTQHAVVVPLSLCWLQISSYSLINFSLCSKPQKLHHLECSAWRKTR